MEVGSTGKENCRYLSIMKITDTIGPEVCGPFLPSMHSQGATTHLRLSGRAKRYHLESWGLMTRSKLPFQSWQQIGPKPTQSKSLKDSSAEFMAPKRTQVSKHIGLKLLRGPMERQMKITHPLTSWSPSTWAPFLRVQGSCSNANSPLFVAWMWASAHTAIFEKAPLVDDGWEIKESRCKIIWIQRNQLPEVLEPRLYVPELTVMRLRQMKTMK